jgi:hypothetical protein
MKRLQLLKRLALIACALVLPSTGGGADRTWIERSDRNAALVFDRLGTFAPEQASYFGAERFDAQVLDLKPGHVARFDAATQRAQAELERRRRTEADARVRQDLDILIEALARQRRTRSLEQRLLVPYYELPKSVFQGLQILLDARNSAARQQHALPRLQRYAGMSPGATPLALLARARTAERVDIAGLIWPYEGEVVQGLANCERFIAGIAELFRDSSVSGWEPAHEQLAAQLRDYCAWVKRAVLPHTRKSHRLPRELYDDRLRSEGVAIGAEQAIALGRFGFGEIRDEMTRIAADIARERSLPSADYRDVLRQLKRDAVPPDRILALYRERLAAIEQIVARERLVTLPQRAVSIRLASEAESAAIPAPYFNLPRLIGNRGEMGEFVLPLRNPNAQSAAALDDYTADAVTWTLIAHEARPGHDLQFASMVERGVSLARAVFAFNSTNAEGWGLYAESLVLSYLAPDARLFSLQWRLLRAARAFLDPMVNLGRMTSAEAKAFLMREVAVSEPFAQQEADRYAFDAPGQAVSYFYGYSKLRELRLKAELALGERFDLQRFNDLVLAQGLLPPQLLERAVLDELARAR